MNQNERAAEIRQRSEELLARADEALEAAETARVARAQRGEGDVWVRPPEAEPSPRPRAAQRAPRAPAPPTAQKYVRPRHDERGRVVEAETFEGTAAQAAKSWEAWIRATIGQSLKNFAEAFGNGIGDLAAEIGTDVRALEKKLADIEAEMATLKGSVDRLVGALERLEAADKQLRALDAFTPPPAGTRPN